MPWPQLFWRRFPERFKASRTNNFKTDDLWYVDDLAWLPDGTVARAEIRARPDG